MQFPWYIEFNESKELQQGDIVPNCPLIIPPKKIEIGDIDVEVIQHDVIILSQSCDLENGNIQNVLVCPYYSLNSHLNSLSNTSKKERLNEVRRLQRGDRPGFHLLNRDIQIDQVVDFMVVDFRNVYGVHIDALKFIVGNMNKRVRLLPPYREHLAQAFARYFMRVGLPQSIDVNDEYLNQQK